MHNSHFVTEIILLLNFKAFTLKLIIIVTLEDTWYGCRISRNFESKLHNYKKLIFMTIE